jgi:hypothetical protein
MEFSGDELAGIADLFGGLTRAELATACEELAFRAGGGTEPAAVEDDVAAAREAFALLEVEHGEETVLTPGPAAFPTLPPHGPDLPHMLDVPERDIDRERAADRATERLEAAAEEALADGDADRAAALREVTYDAEAWADRDLGHVRRRLAEVA